MRLSVDIGRSGVLKGGGGCASVHGCRRCGVEGDGEDGGPAVEGVGDVEGAAEGFDALLGLGEAELG